MKNKMFHRFLVALILLAALIVSYSQPAMNGQVIDIWLGKADNPYFSSITISNFNITVSNGLVGFIYINFPTMQTSNLVISDMNSWRYIPAIKIIGSGHNAMTGTVTVSYTLTVNGISQPFNYSFQMTNGNFLYPFQYTQVGPAYCGFSGAAAGVFTTPDPVIVLLC